MRGPKFSSTHCAGTYIFVNALCEFSSTVPRAHGRGDFRIHPRPVHRRRPPSRLSTSHAQKRSRALRKTPNLPTFCMHGRGTCLALAAAQFRPQIRTPRPTPEATPRSALSHVPSAFDEELRPRTLCVDVNSLILVNARCRDVISRQRTVRRRNFSSMHCAGT